MKTTIKRQAIRPALLGLALATGATVPLHATAVVQIPLAARTAASADIMVQLRSNTPLTAALVSAFDKSTGIRLIVTRNLGAGSYLLHPAGSITQQKLQTAIQKLKANPSVLSASLYQKADPKYVVSPNGHSITLNPASLQKNSTPIVQYRWQQFLGTPVKLTMSKTNAALTFIAPNNIQRNDATTPAGTTASTPATTTPVSTPVTGAPTTSTPTTGTPATSPGVNPGDLTGAPTNCSTAGAPNFAFFHAFSAAFHIIDATGNLRDLSLAATQTTISMADHEVSVTGDTKDFSFSGAPGAISGTIHLKPAQGNAVDASFNGNPAFATGTYHTVDASGNPVDHTFHTNFTGLLGDVAPFTTDKNGFLCSPAQTPANSALVPGPLDSSAPTTPATPTTGATPATGSTPASTATTDPSQGQTTATPGSAPAAGTAPVTSSSVKRIVKMTVQPSTILGFRLIATDKSGVSHVSNVYVRVHKPSSIIKRVQ